MIPVELTTNQAYLFRLLAQAHAWDVKSGSVTIHFDHMGKPLKVEKRETYGLSTGSVQVEVDESTVVVVS